VTVANRKGEARDAPPDGSSKRESATMRRLLVGLAIFTAGALGMVGAGLLDQAWLGPDAVPDGAPLTQLLWLVPAVLPPLLVAAALLARGRTSELGLFLLGWGCLWPVVLAYWVLGTVAARLSGGFPPPIGIIGGPTAMVMALFFAVLPLAGLWFLTTAGRQRRSGGRVSPT
jgi:hypothetical protein